jgi:hypothetical protein
MSSQIRNSTDDVALLEFIWIFGSSKEFQFIVRA